MQNEEPHHQVDDPCRGTQGNDGMWSNRIQSSFIRRHRKQPSGVDCYETKCESLSGCGLAVRSERKKHEHPLTIFRTGQAA
jgi:hypothetical protein